MSNSENVSSADKKLDALYGLTQDAGSPPDIDASLIEAARQAVEEGGAGHPTTFWKNRYRWATAATLLLTSALFISVTDTRPPERADTFEAPVNEALAIEPVTPDQNTEFKGATAPAISSPVSAPPAIPSPAISSSDKPSQAPKVQAEFEQPQIRQQMRYLKRQPAQGAQLSTAESNSTDRARELANAARGPQLKARTNSEASSSPAENSLIDVPISASARLADEVVCADYPGLLVNRVCWFVADNQEEKVDQFQLYASAHSKCSGQSLLVQSANGPPTPTASSTSENFVIKPEESSPNNSADSVSCSSGKLVRHSLARGR